MGRETKGREPVGGLVRNRTWLDEPRLPPEWGCWLPLFSYWTDQKYQRYPKEIEVSWNGGTPSYHPFIDGISPYKLSIWGYPHLWKPPNDSAQLQFLPAIKCTSTFQLGNISELQGLENRLLSQCLCKGSHQAHLRIAQRVQRLLPETMGFTWLHYITSPSWGLDPAGTSLISIHTQPGSVKLIWWFPES